MSSLRELQAAFAAALRDPLTQPSPQLEAESMPELGESAGRLEVYRHNAQAIFGCPGTHVSRAQAARRR